MKKIKILFLTISLSFGLIFGASASTWAAQVAPNFTLPDSKGKQVKLSELKGKFVVLEWFNDGCPYVQKHYKSNNMQKLQKKYTQKGVVWLSILSSAPGKQGHKTGQEINALMTEVKGAQSANLLDPEGKVGRLYEAKTTPHIFVIGPQGKILYQGAIDSNSSFDPADIPGSTNYLAVALDEAMAGKPVSNPATVPYGCSVKY